MEEIGEEPTNQDHMTDSEDDAETQFLKFLTPKQKIKLLHKLEKAEKKKVKMKKKKSKHDWSWDWECSSWAEEKVIAHCWLKAIYDLK